MKAESLERNVGKNAAPNCETMMSLLSMIVSVYPLDFRMKERYS